MSDALKLDPSRDQVSVAPSATIDPITYHVEIDSLTIEMLTDHGWQKVLNDVSLRIPQSKILGLVGESGSGKSVTSLAIMQLLPEKISRTVNGRITVAGRELAGLSRKELDKIRGDEIAMIFQEPMSSLNPAFTIGHQIAEVVRKHTGVNRRQAWARAVECLADVGIPNPADRAKRYPHQFSGGMRQRAMIAMAIACDPKLIIADEPTTALDVTIQAQILELLRRLCRDRGMTMLFVTHNMGVVADICDEVAVMYAGEIVEQAEVTVLFEHPQHPYTEGLLRAVPQLLERNNLTFIPGSTPAPWAMPEGCRFAPRCPYSDESCGQPQQLVRSSEGHTNRCGRATQLDLVGVK